MLLRDFSEETEAQAFKTSYFTEDENKAFEELIKSDVKQD
jgi:hypothetical protein